MTMIKRLLGWLDVEIIDEGVLDVPPWPDTVMPAGEVLQKLGVRSERMQEPVLRRRLGVVHHGLLPWASSPICANG